MDYPEGTLHDENQVEKEFLWTQLLTHITEPEQHTAEIQTVSGSDHYHPHSTQVRNWRIIRTAITTCSWRTDGHWCNMGEQGLTTFRPSHEQENMLIYIQNVSSWKYHQHPYGRQELCVGKGRFERTFPQSKLNAKRSFEKRTSPCHKCVLLKDHFTIETNCRKVLWKNDFFQALWNEGNGNSVFAKDRQKLTDTFCSRWCHHTKFDLWGVPETNQNTVKNSG